MTKTHTTPFAIIMLRTKWAGGDPMGWDAFDYFEKSFLQGETISGNADSVEVHVALRDGKEIAPDLGHRLLAICYSEKEYVVAWERMQNAFHLINPARREACRILEKHASELTKTGEDDT